MARDPKRLQRLQRVRQVQEEVAKATWMEAEQSARSAQSAHARLQDCLRSSQQHLIAPEGNANPAWVALNQSLETHLVQRIKHAANAVDQAQQAADQARAPWQERRVESEGITKLVDHAQEQRKKDSLNDQNRELDEVALRRSQPSDRNK